MTSTHPVSPAREVFERRYALFATAILALALFNLTFRLGQESVTEWDESLYAINAWEALTRGSWLATTFMGQVDYYNSKPPLMIWIIAASFRAFGVGIASLRIGSALSAWLTVLVVQRWTRRAYGAAAALAASLVLATMFGFVHVHAGRSAATDAPCTLLLVLTVVLLATEREHPSRRIWIGPVLAATFLLRGMAVLLPVALIVAYAFIARRSAPKRRAYTWLSVLLFAVPVAAWLVARYQVDGWKFLQPLFMYDFVARTLEPIEAHPGRVYYYLKVLQGHHYDWLFAGLLTFVLLPPTWRAVRTSVTSSGPAAETNRLLLAWAALTFIIPTAMQTKVPWYLNTFYPVFAIGTALVLVHGLSVRAARPRWRVVAAAAAVVVAACVAEGKLIWYSFYNRDLALSGQALILAERDRLRGQRLLLEPPGRANYFVGKALVGANPERTAGRDAILRMIRNGDYMLTAQPCTAPGLELVQQNSSAYLCRGRF